MSFSILTREFSLPTCNIALKTQPKFEVVLVPFRSGLGKKKKQKKLHSLIEVLIRLLHLVISLNEVVYQFTPFFFPKQTLLAGAQKWFVCLRCRLTQACMLCVFPLK